MTISLTEAVELAIKLAKSSDEVRRLFFSVYEAYGGESAQTAKQTTAKAKTSRQKQRQRQSARRYYRRKKLQEQHEDVIAWLQKNVPGFPDSRIDQALCVLYAFYEAGKPGVKGAELAATLYGVGVKIDAKYASNLLWRLRKEGLARQEETGTTVLTPEGVAAAEQVVLQLAE